MELLWFMLVTIGLFGWFVYAIFKGLGTFILTLFGRNKQNQNGTTKFLFFFERRNKMAKKKERDMGFWETLLAIFLIDWLF